MIAQISKIRVHLRSSVDFKPLLWLIVAAGLALRLAMFAPHAPLTSDAAERYAPMARNLLAGNGLSKSSSPPFILQSDDVPGYPLFVAAFYAFTGNHPQLLFIAQFLLELAVIWLVWRMAQLCGLSVRRCRTAVFIALLSPLLLPFSHLVQTEILATFLLTAHLYALARAVLGHGEKRAWLGAGFVSGCALLVRPDVLPAVALMTLAALWSAARRRAMWDTARHAALCTLAAVCVLTPWMLRNYYVFGHLKPLGSAFTQTRQGYVCWLDTWLETPAQLAVYWWHPATVEDFPADALPNADERQAATNAIRTAQTQQSFDGVPDAEFARLAQAAKQQTRPVRTWFIVPLKRLAATAWRVPAYVTPLWLKGLAYLFWCGLLLGTLWSVARRPRARGPRVIWLLAVSLLAGRLVLPLTSALGAEPRYLLEALPACYLLTALGLRMMNDE